MRNYLICFSILVNHHIFNLQSDQPGIVRLQPILLVAVVMVNMRKMADENNVNTRPTATTTHPAILFFVLSNTTTPVAKRTKPVSKMASISIVINIFDLLSIFWFYIRYINLEFAMGDVYSNPHRSPHQPYSCFYRTTVMGSNQLVYPQYKSENYSELDR